MMERPVARRGVATVLMLSPEERKAVLASLRGLPVVSGPELRVVGDDVGTSPGRPFTRVVRRIQYELSAVKVLASLLRADVIQSFTGSLFSSWSWMAAFGLLRLRPYIACATGSDLREVAAHDRGRAGRHMRAFFERAERVLLLNIDMPVVADHLGWARAKFFPFAVDATSFAPKPVPRTYGGSEDLLIFMPSHLDWGVVDNAPGRSSTKGNDRLIRAFARFIAGGGRGHLLMLDRGPDRDVARRLVNELKIAPYVTFKPHMTKSELVSHMNMADVVADQFDVGAFGTTALEAMACGKPVLMHIDMAHADRCYSERPPILNAKTEDEILTALWTAADRHQRDDLGVRARAWLLRFHDENTVAKQLVDIYREIAKR